MLSKEKILFLQILNDFINKRRTAMPGNIDIDNLKLIGKKHAVLGIIYAQTKLPIFQSDYLATVLTNVKREELQKEIICELNIPYFIVKGTTVAALYPVPLLRTMGDTDIVVHTEDREKVHQLLVSKGFQNTSKYQDREWQYFKNRMEIELHDQLAYEDIENDDKQELFFHDFWKYVKDDALDWSYHFLYLVVHLRKHFLISGVGFRQFMDIAVVAKNGNLNWRWIEEKAKQIDLLPFLQVVLAFCNRWFETSIPIRIADIDEEFYETATNKIFDDGVFGFSNNENRDSKAANLRKKYGKFGSIIYSLKLLFPSYKKLCSSKEYGFVVGRPYLLPFAWIYRFVHGVKKKEIVMRTLKGSFARKKSIDSRETMYKQWGL